MQTQKLKLLLAAGLISVGCRAPLSQWQNSPQARGSFCMRGGAISLEGGSGIGREVAGSYQHTPSYATEYSAGYWNSEGDGAFPSAYTSSVDRITGLYIWELAPNKILRVGGGVSITSPQYIIGLAEAEDLLNTLGVVGDLDLDPTIGAHFQIDINYVTRNGVTIGAFYINTTAEATGTLYVSDGAIINSGDYEKDLSNSMFGLCVGARF